MGFTDSPGGFYQDILRIPVILHFQFPNRIRHPIEKVKIHRFIIRHKYTFVCFIFRSILFGFHVKIKPVFHL